MGKWIFGRLRGGGLVRIQDGGVERRWSDGVCLRPCTPCTPDISLMTLGLGQGIIPGYLFRPVQTDNYVDAELFMLARQDKHR